MAPPARASQVPTFPFDTLKKRLQASDAPRLVLHEARVLLAEGGPMRFYRGFALKCGFVALNGATFNVVFLGAKTREKRQLAVSTAHPPPRNPGGAASFADSFVPGLLPD